MSQEDESDYHIVYPGADRTKLAVVQICWALDYELRDYDIASRRKFDTALEAQQYARQLAKDNGLTLILDGRQECFLD
jgi:triphosphoribosyl-dephospho-CoA synthetase